MILGTNIDIIFCSQYILLFVFGMTITTKPWFRALTTAFARPARAQTVTGMSIVVLTLYTGYTIPQPSMIGALRWITYINVRPRFSLFVRSFNNMNSYTAPKVRF